MQQAACSVQQTKKKNDLGQDVSRMSDAILDGIYFFGGKNGAGEL